MIETLHGSCVPDTLPVIRIGDVHEEESPVGWLVEHLWAHAAVGWIAGTPKACKSWLALELAVSVASGTPCLGRFEVMARGPVLVYLAEDALAQVRERVLGLCAHRGIDIGALDLHAITAPSLRLDTVRDQERLARTVRALSPRLLILDPLVRLHRLDENSAAEVSALLSFLRELQRTFNLSLVLVHHTRKNVLAGAQPGQALRGSGDFHAWSDSALYLRRKRDELTLTTEHRSHSAPESLSLRLVLDPAPHLEIVEGAENEPPTPTLATGPALGERVMAQLRAEDTLTRATLRQRLGVKNERLGRALNQLESAGEIERSSVGWQLRAHGA